MNGIKYYALDENEEVPYEFVVIKNVNGEPEFCASFVNTNSLSYGNGVLLKFHQRNDELRAENAKLREQVDAAHMSRLLTENENESLRELVRDMWRDGMCECDERSACAECEYHFPDRMRDLGVEAGE